MVAAYCWVLFVPKEYLALGITRTLPSPHDMKRVKSTPREINRRFDGTDELAAFLGKCPSYVRKLAREKLIPYIKIPGRDKIFDRAKVVEALSRFEVKEIGR